MNNKKTIGIFFICLLTAVSIKAYDYDMYTGIKQIPTINNKVNYGIILPYHTRPIAFNFDSKNGLYTVFFEITDNQGRGISTNFITVANTETLYEVNTRIQKEAWIQYQAQEGSFDTALRDYIKTYYVEDMICR